MKTITEFIMVADCVTFNHKLAEQIEEGVYVISYYTWNTYISNGNHLAMFSSQTKPTDRQIRKWKKTDTQV
ncbi:hypothetical protein VP424E501_P0029 [Vibrio phage 424E50-1]|nr:hypothetical protein VP424E501_P0029 [Vibrio phage 424E50-1]